MSWLCIMKYCKKIKKKTSNVKRGSIKDQNKQQQQQQQLKNNTHSG